MTTDTREVILNNSVSVSFLTDLMGAEGNVKR